MTVSTNQHEHFDVAAELRIVTNLVSHVLEGNFSQFESKLEAIRPSQAARTQMSQGKKSGTKSEKCPLLASVKRSSTGMEAGGNAPHASSGFAFQGIALSLWKWKSWNEFKIQKLEAIQMEVKE